VRRGRRVIFYLRTKSAFICGLLMGKPLKTLNIPIFDTTLILPEDARLKDTAKTKGNALKISKSNRIAMANDMAQIVLLISLKIPALK